MTEQVDLDALIAEARDVVRNGNGPQWESDAERALTDLADALEQSLAELRQERERADEAANHAELALAGRRNAVAALAQEQERADLFKREQVRLAYRRTLAAEAALSRAEETLDRVLSALDPSTGDGAALDEARTILNEYGRAKRGQGDAS